MNLKPFSDDVAKLAVSVGWLHPQVPEVAKPEIEKAAAYLIAAKSMLIQAQQKIEGHKLREAS